MPETPVARSPIRPPAPVGVRDGWEVSLLRSHGRLRLADRTPLTKVLVRASGQGSLSRALSVPFGRAAHDRHGTLVVGAGPDEWLLLARPHTGDAVTSRLDRAEHELVSIVDVTHGRALVRLTGTDAHHVLAKVCAIDFSDDITANGTALRTSVAKIATDVIRDDLSGASAPERSYLLHCERSFGQYLFDSLLDAGREFDISADGFLLDDVHL